MSCHVPGRLYISLRERNTSETRLSDLLVSWFTTDEGDDEMGTQKIRPNSRRWMWLSAGIVGVLFTAAVGFASSISAFDSPRGMMRQHGHDYISWKIERTLRRLDATDEQHTRVEAILEQTLGQLESMHPDLNATHDAVVAALTGATVDRAALETVRSEQLRNFERASQQIANALADVAEVLTPEQRAELAEIAEDHDFGSHRPFGRHGRRH